MTSTVPRRTWEVGETVAADDQVRGTRTSAKNTMKQSHIYGFGAKIYRLTVSLTPNKLNNCPDENQAGSRQDPNASTHFIPPSFPEFQYIHPTLAFHQPQPKGLLTIPRWSQHRVNQLLPRKPALLRRPRLCRTQTAHLKLSASTRSPHHNPQKSRRDLPAR